MRFREDGRMATTGFGMMSVGLRDCMGFWVLKL